MSAIGTIHRTAPLEAQFQPSVQESRVTVVTKPIFQRMKETISSIWTATVIGVRASLDKVSFIFFRALEWIHPSLGPKIENVYLRLGNIFQAVRDAWKEEETRKKFDELRTENRDLRVKVQLLSGMSEQNEHLKLDINHLRGENERLTQANRLLEQAKVIFEQRAQGLVQQQANIIEQEQAVAQHRDIAVAQNAKLEQEKQELINQRNTAAQALILAMATNKETQNQLSQLRQESTDLRSQLQNNQALGENIQRIAQACDKVRRIGEKTELDDDLENLIPLLLDQIEAARSKLQIAKQNLPAHSSAEIAFKSFERILSEVVKSLQRVPQALKLHAHWQQPVNQILHPQIVEV